jgi:hypothetical protein
MSSRSLLTTATALALATAVFAPSRSLAQEASAADHERNAYIVVKGGPYFPTETDAIQALGNLKFEWPTSYSVDLGVGAYWGIFGLQLSGGYLTTGSQDLDLHGFPILLIARARLPLGIIGPYVQGGAGVAITTASFDKIIQGANSSTQASFEAIGGGGVDIYLGALILGAELKYLWLNPNFTVTGSTSVGDFTQKLHMSGITLQAYVGYRW